MGRRGVISVAVATVGALLALAGGAGAQVQPAGTNDAGGFRNVLAVGQGSTATATDLAANQATDAIPPTFVNQRSLYTRLPALAPGVTAQSIGEVFKPAPFGVLAGEVTKTESPRPGVTIQRDTYNVPHIYGNTRADVVWGAGWASAQDRMFFMDVLRHTGRGRLSELIGAGENDANVKADAEQLKLADYTEAELQRQVDEPAARYGADGARLKQDLLTYTAGINAWIASARADVNKLPSEYAALGRQLEDWKPTDTVAVASLIGGIFGLGGGSEVRNADILHAATARFGRRAGTRVFRDFAERDDPEAPVTIAKRFPFDNPGRPRAAAVALTDRGSYTSGDSVVSGGAASAETRGPAWAAHFGRRALRRAPASNATLVAAKHSKSGRPLAVTGPQVAYYSPEVLMEADLHGGGFDARGATFPGISLYVLLGRGRDFSWSATTATNDNVDQFVEKLCQPDGGRPTRQSTHYLYKGRCIPFTQREHVLRIDPVPVDALGGAPPSPRTITPRLLRSVHGPIQGTATVKGAPVAIARARSTYLHEVDSALAFERLNTNQVRSASDFRRVMGQINFVFNWFYNDSRDIAYITSGWFPRRARGTDSHLPTWGTGAFDWKGFDPGSFTSQRIAQARQPQATNPPLGFIANWNNKQAPGWRSADDMFAYGSVHRSERLTDRVRAALRGGRKLDLPGLVGIMGDAATVDLRGQEAWPILRRVIGNTGDADAKAGVAILDAWAAKGAHRRDRDGDSVYEDSAAVALMDAWWNPMVRAVFDPVLGARLTDAIREQLAFDQPAGPGGSAYFSGWWGYLSKDLRTILRRRVRGRFSRRYCGAGSRSRCRAILVRTLAAAVQKLEGQFGADLAQARIPATCRAGQEPQACDQIEFTTAGAIATPPIPWQDRGTFQQAVEVQGRR
jgi:acyl-homoserine lactone acylase PvdQ